MIAPMMKYSFVLYHKEYATFLESIRELGLVDVTISNLEPDDRQRELLSRIEDYAKAITTLREFEKNKVKPVTDFVNRRHAFESYSQASARRDALLVDIARTERELEDLKPWGEYDVSKISNLRKAGIDIHFYALFHKEYESFRKQWDWQYYIKEISRDSLNTYFIVATPAEAPYSPDAQELNAPAASLSERKSEYKALRKDLDYEEGVMASCIRYIPEFERERRRLEEELHLEKAIRSGVEEAEGSVILLEGWVPAERQQEVDAVLDGAGNFYLKEAAMGDDPAPVLLKNNRFFSMFENIGNFYAKPRYGTTDLTPYYSLFYALFFGFCMGDAGYGMVFLVAGLVIMFKMAPKWRGIGSLVAFCGGGAVIMGFFIGSAFGISLSDKAAFGGMRQLFIDENGLFTLAIVLGFVHLLFAMIIKIVSTSQREGLRYAFGPLGWFVIIVSSLAAGLLPGYGVDFSFSSPAYYALLGTGALLMLFLHNPKKNPLVNFGSGLWNTYNNITGLLSDVLSYIRLFALCLSGGVLATVFNDLAVGLSPDIPVVRQISMLLILVIGHSINFFMTALSSFVHPMRLTFVEFYNNAGFEPAQRSYEPLKKEQTE